MAGETTLNPGAVPALAQKWVDAKATVDAAKVKAEAADLAERQARGELNRAQAAEEAAWKALEAATGRGQTA